HEDIHYGQLGPSCTDCHAELNWRPLRQQELHYELGFPLVGTHAVTQCQACHPGAVVGRFQPTDNECLSCHTDDLFAAINPPHLALGYVDNCDRCHLPTTWNQAEIDF
ncbi:MAG: cytochrome c3 family protein, partial [Planctomycetota bacterium]